MRNSLPLAAVVLALAAANATVQLLAPGSGFVVAGCLMAALLGIARWARLTRDDLGLGRGTSARGLRWSWWILAIASAAFGVALLTPWARELVKPLPSNSLNPWLRVAVIIPFSTVLIEEFAFRGVLWGLLTRQFNRRLALWGSAVLFGLWHLLSASGGGAANAALDAAAGGSTFATLLRIGGTVAFTSAAGVLFSELRARTGSLLPSMALHWAANSAGVMFVAVVVR